MLKKSCDILIIGGGLVGLSLAKGLEDANIDYLLVDEKQIPAKGSIRPLALSKSSIAIFKYLGLWHDIAKNTTVIEDIHISRTRAWGHVLLQGPRIAEVVDLFGLQALIKSAIQNKDCLLEGRFEEFKETSVKLHLNGVNYLIDAKLIIAADGAKSSVRAACGLPVETYPEQKAYLSILDLDSKHLGHAFERFVHSGSMALLPWGEKQYAMVYCGQSSDAEVPSLKNIIQEFGQRIPKILKVTHLSSYTLQQIFMPKQTYKNILFLGNAAHTLNPVAGQGFNLTLRDIVVLLELIKTQGISQRIFPYYLATRKTDQRLVQVATRFLADNLHQLPSALLGMSFCALDANDTLKSGFYNYAQGLKTVLPKAVSQYLGAGND